MITILLISLLAGTTYASLGLTGQSNVKSVTLQYVLEGNSNIDYVSIRTLNIEDDISSIPSDATRILLNRLYAAGLIYDEAKAGEEIALNILNEKLPVKIAIGANVKVVYVNTTIYGFRGKYDSEGFIEYSEGVITTQAIGIQVYGNVYRIVQSEPLTYTFTTNSKTVKLNIITQYTSLPSFLLVLAALVVVIKKDRDLAVVGEEHEA